MNNTILIIDDDPKNVETLTGYFEIRGFDVQAVADANEGVSSCKEIFPDIILLNLKFENPEKESLISSVRETVPYSRIFVISATEQDIVQSWVDNLEVDGYYGWPVQLGALEYAINESLLSPRSRVAA